MNHLPVCIEPYSQKKYRFKLQKILTFLVAILIGLSPVLRTIAQETSPFYWDFINVEIDVQKNGDMLVSETQKYVFTQPHTNQRYRYIPLDKVDKITDVTVWENEEQIPSQIGIKDNQISIKWQHQLNAPEAHTFVLKYRVIGGLNINEGEDKVYWKAIFAERSAIINNAKIIVRLPDILSEKILEYKSFGVPTNAQKINSTTVEFVAQQPIPPQQEIEVMVLFPDNILDVSKPNSQGTQPVSSSSSELSSLISVIFLILIFFLIILLLLFGKRYSNSGSSYGYHDGNDSSYGYGSDSDSGYIYGGGSTDDSSYGGDTSSCSNSGSDSSGGGGGE